MSWKRVLTTGRSLPHLARCGDQGDHATTLKERQDALAGPLDELLDILLAGCGRGSRFRRESFFITRPQR